MNATGATFGVAGAVTQTLNGAVIAGLNAQLTPTTFALNVSETFGSTDGTATGSVAYSNTPTALANPGGQVTGVTFGTGVNTLTGNFSGAATGDLVSGTGIPAGTAIIAPPTATSATISQVTTATSTGESVGFSPQAGLSFTDPGFATSATAFTTSGAEGGKASIGVTSVISASVTVTGTILPGGVLTFGGAAGTASTDCTETGWVDATTHAPGNAGAGGVPLLPFGATTPIVAATPTFTAGAYANLIEPLPVANPSTVNLGVGQAKSITLSTAAGNPLYPVTSCAISTAPNNARLVLSSLNSPNVCSVTLTDTGTGVATVTFAFTAQDGFPNTSTPATVTVVIGTPPVDQPLSQTIGGGPLVISCTAPPSQSAAPCGTIVLPAITLNGTTQTSTAPINTIYISDNRGDPTVGWTLTSYMVATGTNPNAGCDTSITFCNSSLTANAALPVNHIAAGKLAISAVACAPYTGNLNPAPAAGAGGTYASTQTLCTASAGTNGGSFTANGTFTLTVPSSTAAGVYLGTVEYLVA